MKPKFALCLFLHSIILVVGCNTKQELSSDSQKQIEIDSAKAVAQKVLAFSDKLDFKTVFSYYSDDSDARYVENGQLFPSLQAVKDNYDQVTPIIQSLHNMA